MAAGTVTLASKSKQITIPHNLEECPKVIILMSEGEEASYNGQYISRLLLKIIDTRGSGGGYLNNNNDLLYSYAISVNCRHVLNNNATSTIEINKIIGDDAYNYTSDTNLYYGVPYYWVALT